MAGRVRWRDGVYEQTIILLGMAPCLAWHPVCHRTLLGMPPCWAWHPAWHATLLGMPPCLAWHPAWHGRYKAPFLAALRAEVAAG